MFLGNQCQECQHLPDQDVSKRSLHPCLIQWGNLLFTIVPWARRHSFNILYRLPKVTLQGSWCLKAHCEERSCFYSHVTSREAELNEDGRRELLNDSSEQRWTVAEQRCWTPGCQFHLQSLAAASRRWPRYPLGSSALSPLPAPPLTNKNRVVLSFLPTTSPQQCCFSPAFVM